MSNNINEDKMNPYVDTCNLRWSAAADAVTGGSPAAPAAGCKTLFHGALDMSLHRA